MLTVTPIPAFNDNYIWALSDARDAVLVDPGDARPCIDFLESRQLNLTAILVTHHHGDHVGGLAQLVARYRPRVYAPKLESIPAVTDAVSGGDNIEIAKPPLKFNVIATPGHTRGHVVYFGEGMLFCGDTLFACGCGRLFEGTAAMMAASLNKLAQLPEGTKVYCAHEYTLSNIRFAKSVETENPALLEREQRDQKLRESGQATLPSTLALEKATNPFLRCHEPSLVRWAQARLKRSPRDAEEVFAVLRQAKDVF